MAKISIDEEICKGCGLCVLSCPKQVIEISKTVTNKKGYFVAQPVNMDKCIGCAFCATMCPDCAIEVER